MQFRPSKGAVYLPEYTSAEVTNELDSFAGNPAPLTFSTLAFRNVVLPLANAFGDLKVVQMEAVRGRAFDQPILGRIRVRVR